VAILVIGVKGRKRYVLNVINRHLDAAATEFEIRRQRDLYYPISATLVEDKANGPAIIQRLQCNLPGVIAINPQGGKVSRMYAASGEWQAGDWYVDRNAAWTGAFVEQITTFPAGHDDMVDSMTQAAAWLLQAGRHTGGIYNAFTGEDITERFVR
jgi:predicted phage terminase large subunit-like protein